MKALALSKRNDFSAEKKKDAKKGKKGNDACAQCLPFHAPSWVIQPHWKASSPQVNDSDDDSAYLVQAEAAGIKDSELDHATSHLGKAVGITQLLRGTVYHAQKRRVYLPADIMAKEGVTESQLTQGEPSPELNNVVYEVASTAKVACSSCH